MKTFLAKNDYHIFRVLCILLAVWMLHTLLVFDWSSFNYACFGLSDWMINYEGGFVRRGFIGQLMLELYEKHPFSIRNAVAVIVIISFLLLQWLLIRLFRTEGWSYTLLFAPFMVYNLMTRFNFGQFAMRRDFLVLLMMWGIFFLYAKYKEKRSWVPFISFQLLSVLILLIYEPSFFFTFPILLVNYYMYLCMQGKPKMLSVIRTLLFFSPAILTMAALCLFNGSGDMATLIWESWMPCMERYPTSSGTDMGAGVEFLKKETVDAMKLHIVLNFKGKFLSKSILCVSFTFIDIAAIYYLTTRLNTVDLRWNKIKTFDVLSMSNILLIQFVFLLPMFTVLSCDWGRNFPYWVVSSLVAYHYFKNDNMHRIPIVSKMSYTIQRWISWFKVLDTPWIYILILIALPIPFAGKASIYDSIPMQIFVQIRELISSLAL